MIEEVLNSDLKVGRFVNSPVNSNCFVLYREDRDNCIVIDPGTNESDDLLGFLSEKKLRPDIIMLTHEHFDHIWGVNKLKDLYNCKILCSGECSESIVDSKKNMSVFYDQLGFECYPADILTDDLSGKLIYDGSEVEFIETKGHSDGSICILVDNFLFTGDTIIYNTKTVVKLPGGDKEKLRTSLSTLLERIRQRNIMIFPGHGKSFLFKELSLKKLL